LHRAKLDQDRYQGLAQYNVASHQRLETAQADLSKAQAGLARGEAGVQAAKGQLQVIATGRPGREAALQEAEAALALARIDLENTEIKAGIDGVVGHKAIVAGQYVRPGAILMTIVPIQAIYVDANFKETQLTRMKPGQKAVITVDAYPGIRLNAHILSFAPASGALFSLLPPENATGNFTKVVQRIPVRLSLDSKDELDGKLRPGLSVDVTVDTR
jgi:membrane fusion protein (multidrug efflux system)